MVAVTTSITSTNVKIAFTDPSTNGSPILKYRVVIRQSDGVTFTEETNYCDASTSTIIADKYCLVPMTVLRSSPYSLAYSNLVVAQVQAYNSKGWGALSPSNTAGASIQTEP